MRVPLPDRRATRELARRLAAQVQPGDLVVLEGALGAGKTFLVRALARALALPTQERVTSPTFALVQELPTHPPLVHADLYRLESGHDVDELGLLEARADAVLLVEWGERFLDALGGDALVLSISLSPRVGELRATGPRSTEQLAALVGERAQSAASG